MYTCRGCESKRSKWYRTTSYIVFIYNYNENCLKIVIVMQWSIQVSEKECWSLLKALGLMAHANFETAYLDMISQSLVDRFRHLSTDISKTKLASKIFITYENLEKRIANPTVWHLYSFLNQQEWNKLKCNKWYVLILANVWFSGEDCHSISCCLSLITQANLLVLGKRLVGSNSLCTLFLMVLCAWSIKTYLSLRCILRTNTVSP